MSQSSIKNKLKLFLAMFLILSTIALFFCFSFENKKQSNFYTEYTMYASNLDLNEVIKPVDALLQDNLQTTLQQYEDNGYNIVKSNNDYFAYKKFALKKLMVFGNINKNYDAEIDIVDSYGCHYLAYKTEQQTEYAFNMFLADGFDVQIDKVVSSDTYYENTYDYSSYNSWGAQAIDIQGYREYLTDNLITTQKVVVVMDTGINTAHHKFANRLLRDSSNNIVGYACTSTTYTYSGYDFEDDNGHGTHVAGIICDLTPDNVKILPIKIGAANNYAYYSAFYTAYSKIYSEYSTQYDIACVNTSFSGFEVFESYYQNLRSKNILTIVSAGNDSEDVSDFGEYDTYSCVLVSALKQSGTSVVFDDEYSNFGKHIDIAAPGSLILSCYINPESPSVAGPYYYATMSGTSMAAPHISGIVALLSLYPNYSAYNADQIEQALYQNVVDLGTVGWDNLYGYGAVNIKYFEFEDRDVTITASATGNGTINPSGQVLARIGEDYTFTFTPANGSSVSTITVDGTALLGTDFTNAVQNGYTFTCLLADHTISVAFTSQSYTITASATGNGTISPSGTIYAGYGQSKSFTFSPNVGYSVYSIVVDGTELSGTQLSNAIMFGYTFSNIRANHTIAVSFGISRYTITPNANAGGTISPGTQQTIYYGQDITFYITPNVGYHINSIIVDGVLISSNLYNGIIQNGYTFEYIQNNHTINVIFAVDTFTISTSVTGNGTISPNNPSVEYSQNQTLTISPNVGNYIQSIIVDGSALLGTDFTNAVQNGNYTFENITQNHTFAVIFQIYTFTITPSANAGGTISPNTPQIVSYGQDLTFTITPNNGYHITSIVVDGTQLSDSQIEYVLQNGYTFENIQNNHTISATFEINTYTITPSASTGGTISPNTPQIVSYGQNITFNISANTGYHVSDLIINGVSITGVTLTNLITYTFDSVSRDQTISVIFAIDTFTITPSANAGGTISPNTPQIVSYGQNLAFNITPNNGYHITSIVVDGTQLSDSQIEYVLQNGYTFENIQNNHTINVTFAVDTFTIIPSAGVGGTISPNLPQPADYGENKTFIITPNIGYHILAILIDNSPLSNSQIQEVMQNGYTFENVQDNHTIDVTFEINTYTITPSASAGGTISPNTTQTVSYGQNITFDITPNQGYYIDKITVDGNELEQQTINNINQNGFYTLQHINSNHQITVYFEILHFSISLNCLKGDVEYEGSLNNIEYGSIKEFTLNPNDGYVLDVVTINGEKINVQNNKFTTTITSNISIIVVFKIKEVENKSSSIIPLIAIASAVVLVGIIVITVFAKKAKVGKQDKHISQTDDILFNQNKTKKQQTKQPKNKRKKLNALLNEVLSTSTKSAPQVEKQSVENIVSTPKQTQTSPPKISTSENKISAPPKPINLKKPNIPPKPPKR